MIWFFLSIASAFLHALHLSLVKKFLKNISQYVLASGVYLCTGLILLTASFLKGVPEIGSRFYEAVLGTVSINFIATILNYRALMTTDLSLAAPFLAFTPVFSIFTSFILLRELPTWMGAIGICLVFSGTYILNFSKGSKGLLDPWKEIFKNKGMFCMFMAAFLYSVATNFDKLAFLNSDPVFGPGIVFTILGLAFFVFSLTKRLAITRIFGQNSKKLFLIGVLTATSNFFINSAYRYQIVPYVISVKRLSIVFSVIIGGMFFKEKNINRRLAAAVIILMGLLAILLF